MPVWSALLTCLLSLYSQAQENAAKPNILIILADDLGYHDLSYYGTTDIRTPHIDSIRRRGLRFDHFYATSVCSPTRASLMSGRYPDMVGVPGLIRSRPEENFGYLKPGALLLPKLLQGAGYRTALVGKWNLGLESPNTPNEKGFDYFHGFLDDMMDDYYTHLRNKTNFMRENAQAVNPTGHATDLFTDWAVEWINKQKNGAPFFLYLAYNAPHFPVQPPADWLAKVKGREPEMPERRARLVALIEHMDTGIGKVIQALKKTGAYQNTLVLFLSDNGGHLESGADNGPLRDGKQSVYEGGIRVPAVMAWPGQISPGTRTDQRVHVMDIYPTLAEIAGVPIQHTIDGVSILPLLKDPTRSLADRPLFFTRREGNMRYGGQTIQAVISGNFKLLQNSPFAPYELYNLYDDPYEQHNIIDYDLQQHQRLQQLLIKQMQKAGSIPWQKPDPEN